MLDIKLIRNNPDLVKDGCRKKQVKIDIDRFLEVDKLRRETLQALEDMSAQKNKSSKKISQTKNEKEKKKIILEMQELDKNSDRLNKKMKDLEKEFNDLMLLVPNLPQEDVPVGKDEKDNVVLREVAASGEPRPAGRGEKPKFDLPAGRQDFQPKNYLELGEKLDLIDINRAAKVSGTRFSYLKKEAVSLKFALRDLAAEMLLKEGFLPIDPPLMIKTEMAQGMGYLEQNDREEAYLIPQDNLCLIGTAEQSLGAMHADEILEEKTLPRRYFAFTPCFRREAGSYGKDTKGIFRVHQFDKVEMFSFCNPKESKKEHQFFLEIEENLMQLLKLPYRVVQLCSGDLARPSAATFDIETWLPSENRYRETHSTSNCTDFQARRLNIRYKDKAGKLNFVHTVNGTAFAIGRTIIAIMENYQQKEGSILVPEILQKYLDFKVIKNN